MVFGMHMVPFLALGQDLTPEFNKAGFNTNPWKWNEHGPNWIYAGGPDANHEVYYNQWDDEDNLPTASHAWAAPHDVDYNSVDPWVTNIGGGIY